MQRAKSACRTGLLNAPLLSVKNGIFSIYVCCVYVYMYVCDCVYVYMYTHTHTHTHTHKIFFEDCGLLNVLPNVTTVFFFVEISLSPCTPVYTRAHANALPFAVKNGISFVCTCIYQYLCICISMCICICIYIYVYVYV
jgi:hypothetical protein